VDEPSVLATVPMWFGLLDETKADAMITQLAGWITRRTGNADNSEHSPNSAVEATISDRSGALHGLATVGEYRYHVQLRILELAGQRALALDGSLGHVRKYSRI